MKLSSPVNLSSTRGQGSNREGGAGLIAIKVLIPHQGRGRSAGNNGDEQQGEADREKSGEKEWAQPIVAVPPNRAVLEAEPKGSR